MHSEELALKSTLNRRYSITDNDKNRTHYARAGEMVLGSLVYVRYLDHVLFKYSSPFRYRPIERETVGWLVKQDDEAVWIVADRSVESLKHQLDSDSGLIILKSDILKMKHLGKSYRLNIVRQIEILAEYALQEKEVKNSVQR